MLKYNLLLVAALALGYSCQAQITEGCAITLGSIPFDCHVGSCQVDSSRTFPIGGSVNHTAVECYPIQCCGLNYGTTCNVVGFCTQAELKDPTVRTRILELAKNASVLISTCRGDFMPVEAALNDDQKPLINLRKPQQIWKASR